MKRDSSSCFLLEFRQPDASFDTFTSTDPATTGILVRIAPCSYSVVAQSQLIDATPATTSFNDAALAVGRSLYDPISKITLETTAVGASGATVQISLGADTADGTPPSPPANLTASAPDAGHVNLSWAASTDNVAVAAYKIYRDGSYLGSTTSTGFNDSGVTGTTTYIYAVSAVDAAGNRSLDATVTVTTPTSTSASGDTTPPTAPTGLAATRMGNRSRVDLNWAPATDNVGIASYRLYRNGTLTATVVGGTLSYTDAKAPKGSDSYYVVAVDGGGNTSAPSNIASV
jgi:fibronectin type 3 domain-containing protein